MLAGVEMSEAARLADGGIFRTKHRCSHVGNTAELIKGRRSKEHIARSGYRVEGEGPGDG